MLRNPHSPAASAPYPSSFTLYPVVYTHLGEVLIKDKARYTRRRDDKKGAPAYSPAVMLKIIFYCYSRGIITSRPIEYACKTNIIVKALARDAEPDRDTIAHFISSQAEAVKDLFAQVLLKCYALGL
jgi:transposase